MALVDVIDSITPQWAKERPWWWNLWRVGAVTVDGILEALNQGRRAGMPNAVEVPGIPGYGGFEDVGSLYLLAPDLGVIPGLIESPPMLAYRLRHAHDPAAGGWEAPPILGMFEQLAGVLSGPGVAPPLMRMIFIDNSSWWTRSPDGTITLHTLSGTGYVWHTDGTTAANPVASHIVDWDSTTQPPPPDQGFVGRWVLVIYRPVCTPYGTSGPMTYNDGALYGHLWNSLTQTAPTDPWPDLCTYGTNSPSKLVDVVRGVVKQREAAGYRCIWIIIASDPTSFAPDGTSSAPPAGSTYPDGTWGWDSKFDNATNRRIPSRNSTAEYWRMPDE